MKRELYDILKSWKNKQTHLPLIIRGARQVGKSFLVEEFGKTEFSNFEVINFEKHPHLKNCFSSLDPKDILKELELEGRGIKDRDNALLFLDEIQDCPNALKSLRYFAEDMPNLHVIAAGSLLEFVLEEKGFSFPVGRAQFINLGPFSFTEYLKAKEENAVLKLIEEINSPEEISDSIHKRLLNLVHEFFCVGGMPRAVQSFLENDSFLEVQRTQASILELYALDFAKYARKSTEHQQIQRLFDVAPELIGKHFKYRKIDPENPNASRDYKNALKRLRQARLIQTVHLTKGNGLPLRAEKNEKKFKIFMLDIGLLLSSLGWNSEYVKKQALGSVEGILAEQFVAQELLNLEDPFMNRSLYYWENTSRASSAEVDFLVNIEQTVVPIEVKSGTTGRLKSIQQFMQSKGHKIAVQISEKPLKLEGEIISIPFYLISQLSRLLRKKLA